MAKRARTKLAGMDFDTLMKLREQVEHRLHEYRTTLEQQLASLGGSIASLGAAQSFPGTPEAAQRYLSGPSSSLLGMPWAKPRASQWRGVFPTAVLFWINDGVVRGDPRPRSTRWAPPRRP
jgi:hypothetical protein